MRDRDHTLTIQPLPQPLKRPGVADERARMTGTLKIAAPSSGRRTAAGERSRERGPLTGFARSSAS